ncbi:interleukin-21 isoform X2 [Alosa sapidissima]|uniref:interleukin-21 isoform X2 n=1 Tax=Alosa sapidissima TaxID=34773 RepID=UPI001C085378|nr:interleukin-21 isoform X2 [Alosa sapidissima]
MYMHIYIYTYTGKTAQAAMPLKDLKMLELYKDVKRLNKSLQHDGSLSLNNPGTEIKECCMASALQCYRSQLLLLKVSSTKLRYKVCKSLSSPLISEKLEGSSEDCQKNPQCQSCDLYPNTNSKEFMSKLTSLLEMANSN